MLVEGRIETTFLKESVALLEPFGFDTADERRLLYQRGTSVTNCQVAT